MTRRDDLGSIRKMVEQRRSELATTHKGMTGELDALKAADRDPEYEEAAQVAQAEFTLNALQDSHQREMDQIDAALQRLDENRYGVCVDCELDIPFERLEAVPYVLRCADCASTREASSGRHATL